LNWRRIISPRVERSLYHRAVGYNYEAVKIFLPANRSNSMWVGKEVAQILGSMVPGRLGIATWQRNE
jgi:hypothetical protein